MFHQKVVHDSSVHRAEEVEAAGMCTGSRDGRKEGPE
jgi:hypothetical protein